MTSGGNLTADLALDGSTDPNIQNGKCAYSESDEENAWWMVKLDGEYEIHSITIYSADAQPGNNHIALARFVCEFLPILMLSVSVVIVGGVFA